MANEKTNVWKRIIDIAIGILTVIGSYLGASAGTLS